MGKGNVEYKLRKAVKHATPDMKDQIIEKCKTVGKDGSVPFVINTVRRNKTREHIYALAAAAAAILLAFNIGLDVYGTSQKNRVMTVVDIDVNPSIELNINGEDRIVSVRAINEDAIAILDGMDLTGAQTKVAVNAIMGSMFEHGYLKGETDSVLVSVSNKDANKALEVERDVTENIDSLMKAYSQDVSVIGQTIEKEDQDLLDKSNDYGISEGKVALINKILSLNNVYTFDELAKLNITELNEIICSIQDMEDPENPANRVDDEEPVIDPIISDPAVSTQGESGSNNTDTETPSDGSSETQQTEDDVDIQNPALNLEDNSNPEKDTVSSNNAN